MNVRTNDNSGASDVLVVGDRFIVYSNLHEDVITYSTFETFEAQRAPHGETNYHLGQGLTQEQRERIARYVTESSDSTVVGIPVPASQRETHKHEERNILVSQPRKLTNNLFELDLLIDGRCSDLSDHQTGQHIAGMVLVEAGRQAFLAVTERFFIPEGDSSEYYFVTRSKQAIFRSFAFPLPTVIRYAIADLQVEDRDRLRFNVFITFYQAGQAIAELHYSFTAYRKRYLVRKECEKAAGVLDAFFGDPVIAPPSPTQALIECESTQRLDGQEGSEPEPKQSAKTEEVAI